MTYQYRPLPSGDVFTTRVFVLAPATDPSEPIVGQLEFVRFAEGEEGTNPPYEPMSYMWGPTGSGHTVHIDDPQHLEHSGDVSITENCDAALRQLRHKDQPRRIWVDAICINQNDVDERSHQVQNMGLVFSRGKGTIIWTGVEDEDTEPAFSLWNDYHCLMTSNHTAIPDAVPDRCLYMIQWIKDRPKHKKMSLIASLSRPYFQRLWIIQEIFASTRYRVVCGTRTMPQVGFFTFDLEEHFRTRALLGALSIQKFHPLNNFVFSDRLLRLMDLFDLIMQTTRMECSDPRDKIFGVQSCLDPNDRILVDYTMSTEAVFRSFEEVFFQKVVKIDFALWRDTHIEAIHGLGVSMGLESEVSDLPRRWHEMLFAYGLGKEGSPEGAGQVDGRA